MYFFFRMVHSYKKKAEDGRDNYQDSQAMTDAYYSVMGEEMSAFGVNTKSFLVRVQGDIPVNAHVG